MINRISTTGINFTGYRQRFTNEEFRQCVDKSLIWAKENIDNSKYFKTKKQMNKKLESNAKGAFNTLESYKQVFKKSDFMPQVELSLQERELVGKVTHLNSTPIEVRTELPCNLKKFFERITTGAKAQVTEERLSQEWWSVAEKIKYFEAKQNKRYKELIPEGKKEPIPFVIVIDSLYSSISEKLIKLISQKNEIELSLEKIKPKLQNKSFKLKVK